MIRITIHDIGNLVIAESCIADICEEPAYPAEIWVTLHDKRHKLHDMQSISTAATLNPICTARARTDSVCAKCYANAQLKYKKSLREHLEQNFRILTARLLTVFEAERVKISTLLARIESFGDVADVIQARNYIRIIATHPETRFGVWTKNLAIWNEALDLEGKAENMTLVYSSPKVNERAMLSEREGRYVDHIFTVWTPEVYDEIFIGSASECAGLSCMECRKCYCKGGSYYIDERLRLPGGKKFRQ